MTFLFNKANLQKAEAHIAKYPEGRQRSAVLPLLHIAQQQNECISPSVISCVASMLKIKDIEVAEVASFYSMFRQSPVGKNVIQVCTTTPCMLCGSDEILKACEKELNIKAGESTDNGLFYIEKVECIGRCTNAPVAIINGTHHNNATPKTIEAEIQKIKNVKNNINSQNNTNGQNNKNNKPKK